MFCCCWDNWLDSKLRWTCCSCLQGGPSNDSCFRYHIYNKRSIQNPTSRLLIYWCQIHLSLVIFPSSIFWGTLNPTKMSTTKQQDSSSNSGLSSATNFTSSTQRDNCSATWHVAAQKGRSRDEPSNERFFFAKETHHFHSEFELCIEPKGPWLP